MEEIASVLLKTSRQTNHRIAVGRYCSAHIIVFLRSAVPKESTYGTDVIGADAQQLLPDIITNRLLCNTFFNELPGVFLIQDFFLYSLLFCKTVSSQFYFILEKLSKLLFFTLFLLCFYNFHVFDIICL